MKAVAYAPGKINLLLKVGAPKADGYHPLTTIFHCLDLCETVELETKSSGFNDGVNAAVKPPTVSGDTVTDTKEVDTVRTVNAISALPKGCSFTPESENFAIGKLHLPQDLDGPNNLVLRALVLLRERYAPTAPRVQAAVVKRIPVKAGLAGGSADAIATLACANLLWGLGLDKEQLAALGRELGADVPFGLWGGNCLGTGRGDRIESLPAGPIRHWVLAISEEGLSTPEVFRALDAGPALPDTPPPLCSQWRRALEGNNEEFGRLLDNDLQQVAFGLRPELQSVFNYGLNEGALGGVLSGSGPTLAFLVADRESGLSLAARLEKLDCVAAALVTGSTSRSVWARFVEL